MVFYEQRKCAFSKQNNLRKVKYEKHGKNKSKKR